MVWGIKTSCFSYLQISRWALRPVWPSFRDKEDQSWNCSRIVIIPHKPCFFNKQVMKRKPPIGVLCRRSWINGSWLYSEGSTRIFRWLEWIPGCLYSLMSPGLDLLLAPWEEWMMDSSVCVTKKTVGGPLPHGWLLWVNSPRKITFALFMMPARTRASCFFLSDSS